MSEEQVSQLKSAKELLGEYDMLEDTPQEQTPRSLSDPKYTFEGSALNGSDLAEEAYRGQDALFGDSEPHKARQKEQPVHRLFVMLKAQGFTNKEIAEKTGVVPQTVCEALKQPWARIRLRQELEQAGRDALHGLLASQAEDSVWTLIEVRDKPNALDRDRITAADKLLDRYLGKPNQPITHASTVDASSVGDEELLKIVRSKDGSTMVST